MIRGSCLCGDVAFCVDGPLELRSHCHCSNCRKAHGSAFATYGRAAVDDFRFARGAERVRRFESSPGFFRSFCGRCGSVVPADPAGDRIFIPAGCLDDDPGTRALAHIFVASKAPWHEISDDLPRFDAYPPGFATPDVPERSRADAGEGRIGGSCLCGAVVYAIEGRPDLMRHCHCSRCRKARSAAHASNAFAPLDRFHWLRGEEQLELYPVPGAKRFANAFCGVCGSCLPRLLSERGVAVVPAGTLDDDPAVRPSEHIFVGSKASWVEISDDVPQYDEYPTGS